MTVSYAKNRSSGHILTLAAPYDRLANEGAMIGSIFGVALVDVDSGDEAAFQTEGVFELAKTSAQAWTAGQKIYWDNANKRCDSDPALGALIGAAEEVADNPSSTGIVRLDGISLGRSASVAREGAPAATSKNTAGGVTLTASEVLSGILVADCNGAGRTYTFPTAALLVAAVPGAKVGDLLRLKVVNGSDAAEAITLAEGSGGGWDANQTATSRVIGQNTSKDVLIRLTNVTASSEAYVLYA